MCPMAKKNEMPLEIIIKTRNNAERNKIGERIHNALRGNADYVDNAIVLNIDQNKRVRLWVFDESNTEIQLNPVFRKEKNK